MLYDIHWVREAVDRVKEDGRGNIRVHPNGFIQLDLIPVAEDWHASYQKGHSGATLRLHIWNPPGHELPHQGTMNELHTHVFDMHSTVVLGKMTQRLYGFTIGSEWHQEHVKDPEPMMKLYKAIYAKSSDSRLEDTGLRGQAIPEWELDVHKGQTYTQPAFTFHDSDPYGCTVTVMEKTEVHEGDAYVLIPSDIEPDNSYDRANAAPSDWLWEAVVAAIA
jgi:hypothetical protein